MALLAPLRQAAIKFPEPIPLLTRTARSNNHQPTSAASAARGTRTWNPRAHMFAYTSASKTRSPTIGGRFYKRQNSCLIFPPPRGEKPKAIIKFLGGAFIGAIPEVTYSYLIELLAKEGFLVVSVPYDVTFDHSRVAREVFERFHCCLDELLTSGLPFAGLGADDLVHLPIYSVGHSNGALLQVLVGSYFSENIPKANAIISFNNRPASEAVPYFEQFGPLVREMMPIMEVSPIYSMFRSVSGDALNNVLDTAGVLSQNFDPEAIVSLNKFVGQLQSVMNQVTQGVSEFKPSPSENRGFVKQSYNIQNTLLIKFSTDAIDESDILESILRPRVESRCWSLEKVNLPGNHITPCAQDVRWGVGSLYTPADAFAQALKSLSLNETRTLARTIVEWLDGINHE